MTADKEYVEWLSELKQRFCSSQAKAAVRVNTAMLEYYWSLGKDIVKKKAESKWGSGFFNQLSADMRSMFPNEMGFSVTNLKYMKCWYLFYYEKVTKCHQVGDQIEKQIRHQPGDELEMPNEFGIIPWRHHVEIFTKSKSIEEAFFYIHKVVEEGWSRSWLEKQMVAKLFKTHGSALTNFDNTLPAPQSELKAVKFIPEFAGKLNFYVTAADKLLRGTDDNPSVGILICKTAKKTIVEWSLQDI
jgi:predicted nuclease of restriction endonuclease-like (RecB) superfamily